MIPNGTWVRTVAVPDPPTDWSDKFKRTRRFGVVGVVIHSHDSHGVCYEVRHEDDLTVGAYEPEELAVLEASDLVRMLKAGEDARSKLRDLAAQGDPAAQLVVAQLDADEQRISLRIAKLDKVLDLVRATLLGVESLGPQQARDLRLLMESVLEDNPRES